MVKIKNPEYDTCEYCGAEDVPVEWYGTGMLLCEKCGMKFGVKEEVIEKDV